MTTTPDPPPREAEPPAPMAAPTRAVSARVAWQLVRRDPVAYFIAWTAWVLFYLVPIPIGLLLKYVLDHIGADPGGRQPVWTVLVVLGILEVGRWLGLWFAAVQWHGCWVAWHTIPRLNLLRSLVGDPGPAAHRLPGSPGEAVSRFRDDTMDLALVLDVWLDVSAVVVSSLLAVAIMFRIDARITVVVVMPVLAVLWLCHWLTPRLRAWRREAREATAAVTSFIGDTFGAITAVKAAGAESAVLHRFTALGTRRASAARRDEVGTQLVQSLSGATANLGLGIALLLVAPAVRSGRFTVGDLGLFTTYITVLAALPRWIGRLGAYQRQADVSVERLAALLSDPDPAGVVAAVPTYLRHGPGPFTPQSISEPLQRSEGARFERLEVRHLRVGFPGGGGVEGISFDLVRGSFTVLTGPVGAGKSTVLRSLLGLIAVDGGIVRWNGVDVSEPSTLFVPPKVSYLPQLPRLFSETLAETILLGVDDAGLADAIRLSCLDDDVESMSHGLDTIVGAKGVRLSGGQIQRAGAARAFVRRPELLVVDDLSSALDVGTEARLWERVFAATDGSTTMLVVSHRPAVLAHADQVISMEAGKVISVS